MRGCTWQWMSGWTETASLVSRQVQAKLRKIHNDKGHLRRPYCRCCRRFAKNQNCQIPILHLRSDLSLQQHLKSLPAMICHGDMSKKFVLHNPMSWLLQPVLCSLDDETTQNPLQGESLFRAHCGASPRLAREGKL